MPLPGHRSDSSSPASSSVSSPVTATHAEHEPREESPLLPYNNEPHAQDAHEENLKSSSKLQSRLVIVVVSCAGFLNIFTAQSIIIMLPAISRAYNIPTQQQPLIASIYNVSSGALILLGARLADVYGRRLIFLLGAAAFTLASALLPFSPTATILFVFRALQGMSVAATVPSSIGILSSTFPEGKRRNAAFVVFNAAASLGAVLGNLVGGIVGGCLSWSWVFWFAAMLGGMITLGAFLVLEWKHDDLEQDSDIGDTKLSKPAKSYVDWIGGLLITASLGILTSALSFTNDQAALWSAAQVAASVVLAVLFFLRQRRLERFKTTPPLIPTSIFKRKGFTAALVTYAGFLSSFSSFLIYLSFFFQEYQGLSILEATWRFIPSGVSCVVLAPFLPPLLTRFSHYHLLLLSTVALLIPSFLLALPIPPSASYFAYVFPALLLTCSVELASPILSLFVVRSVAKNDQSLGGGLLQTANNVGKALGLAIAGGVRAAVDDHGNGSSDGEVLRGLRAAQWVNSGLAVLTMAVAAHALKGFRTGNGEQEIDEPD